MYFFFFFVENKNQCTWIYNYFFHRANHAKNTFTRWNERTWHTHKPNCFGQKNYWHTERIRICILFRIRLQHFFYLSRQFSLSLSLSPIFGNSIATIPFFFFPPIFGNSIATKHLFSFLCTATILFFFPSNFQPKSSSFLQFWQLGCHNFFSPHLRQLHCQNYY